MKNDITRRITAEFFGTFWLTFGGCGAAVLAAAFPSLGIGFLGVALAFGLTVLTMAYAVGHISGGHFNPAVTIGLWSAGRCANQHVLPYVIAQVIGAVAAAGMHRFRQGGLGCWWLLLRYRGTADLLLHLHHYRYDLEGCRRGLCRHSDRFSSDIDPLDLDPCYQHFCQSRAQHRPRFVRGRGIYWTALAVLGRPLIGAVIGGLIARCLYEPADTEPDVTWSRNDGDKFVRTSLVEAVATGLSEGPAG